MAKRPNHPDIFPSWSINHDQTIIQQHQSKIPSTTRYTQPQNKCYFPTSFALGKNDLLQNNTSSEFDSSDPDSDVSFQERLDCHHEKHLLNQTSKYLQIKGAFGANKSFQCKLIEKSAQVIKDIEQKVFDEIKRSYGSSEVQKIKLTLKFIKRNEDLTRIYFQVIKSLPQIFQTTMFFLLKHSVIVYLQGRQLIGGNQTYMSDTVIKQYIKDNILKITEQVIRDEKLQLLFNPQKEQMLKKKLLEFLSQWMQGFFMAKQGYPCTAFREVQKNPKARVLMREDMKDREKRKKIKEF